MEMVTEALSRIGERQVYFSSTYARVKNQIRNGPIPWLLILSNRERQILEMLGALKSDDEIAVQLGLCARTVETHRANIRKKLGIKTHLGLLRFAQSRGFTESMVRWHPGSC